MVAEANPNTALSIECETESLCTMEAQLKGCVVGIHMIRVVSCYMSAVLVQSR